MAPEMMAAIKADEDGFVQFLSELINLGCIEGVPLGIAKQLVSGGIDSLSEKQVHVFSINVVDGFVRVLCAICHGNISWSEMSLACDNGWNCGHCICKLEKLDDE